MPLNCLHLSLMNYRLVYFSIFQSGTSVNQSGGQMALRPFFLNLKFYHLILIMTINVWSLTAARVWLWNQNGDKTNLWLGINDKCLLNFQHTCAQVSFHWGKKNMLLGKCLIIPERASGERRTSSSFSTFDTVKQRLRLRSRNEASLEPTAKVRVLYLQAGAFQLMRMSADSMAYLKKKSCSS